MKTSILYTLLFCAASTGFVGWRLYAVRTQATPHYEILEDPSLSHVQDCEAMVALAERAVHADVTANSTLTILVVGDQSTANEPWRLARYPIPTTRKAIEGRNAILRRQQDLLLDVLRKCRTIHRTTISPIFLGIKQALADLRAQGCDGTSHCQLFVDSDLEENVETSIFKRAEAIDRRTPIPPRLLDNNGIAVSFCGFTATVSHLTDSSGREIRRASARGPERDDRLTAAWKSMFSETEGVAFDPYCPNP